MLRITRTDDPMKQKLYHKFNGIHVSVLVKITLINGLLIEHAYLLLTN